MRRYRVTRRKLPAADRYSNGFTWIEARRFARVLRAMGYEVWIERTR
jgi:hypothetical protein